jgi:hypothetical protein
MYLTPHKGQNETIDSPAATVGSVPIKKREDYLNLKQFNPVFPVIFHHPI